MNTTRSEPNYENFLKAVTRSGRPERLPFYEHLASPGFVARRTGTPFESMSPDSLDYWRVYVDFWLGMGFDVVPMEVGLNCPLPEPHRTPGSVSQGSEERICIRSWEDYERYPWPSEEAPIAFRYFEMAAELLPEGARIVGGVGAGPYEWSTYMLGVVGMSLLLFDQPDLVEEVCRRIGSLHLAALRQLAQMDAICALRQGDDLGFKTSTFLKPDDLRRLIFPIYRKMAAIAHAAGKPFVLHSCGNLNEVYPDIIDGCKIDAKHSFEEVILPVEEFKRLYGDRCTPLGGLDVDMICRAPRDELLAYTRRKVEQCYGDGWWALGTGNSLTDYMPVENFLMVLEEGRRVAA